MRTIRNMMSIDITPSAQKDDYQIHLNFLPVEMNVSPCLIYRRLCASPQEERPIPLATAQRLPAVSADEKEWQLYWILHEPTEGFDAFEYQATWSADLSRRILFESLRRSVVASLQPQQYRFPPNNFIQEVSLIMATHPEGNEALVVQPYFLKASRQLGLLVDFHFNLGRDIPFSRRIQQLSLSLDKNFRRNVDYYVDRSSKVRKFLETRWSVFESLALPGASSPLGISKDFVSLKAERLRPKTYVFAGGKESRSQFTGLRDLGPLQALEHPPRLLFVFREQDRLAARRLALALKGLKQRGQYNFPGFNELFKTTLEIDANPIVLPDLSSAAMENALKKATEARKASPNILPVIVLPNGDDNGYLAQKAHFSHAGMPTQVCTLRILEDEESLKWAVANLALQIFCKAGDRPWKVRPTAERSLIIGISQSHKIRFVDEQVATSDGSAVARFFRIIAYSSDCYDLVVWLALTTDYV
jgi:hypothetical protein